MRALLLSLLDDVPPARRPVLQRQLELLDAAVASGFPDAGERALASVADHAGLGAAKRAEVAGGAVAAAAGSGALGGAASATVVGDAGALGSDAHARGTGSDPA